MMEYQKFIPEGWNNEVKPISKDILNIALINGSIMEGIVTKCDSNYNLYIDLGNSITGIIPREEVEETNIDETGFPKPNICTSKVNKIVQFKVKDITKDNIAILSRKSVGKEANMWVKSNLKEGMIVCRNNKEYTPLWCFYRDWWRNCWIITYRGYFSF